MASFNLASYGSSSGPRSGIVVKDHLFDVAEATGRPELSTVLAILADWRSNEPLLREAAASLNECAGLPVSSVKLLAPILYPPAVFCAGANYSDHVTAIERKFNMPPSPDPRGNGGTPFHFLKIPRCCVGTGSSVRAPTAKFDYEVELVAVIGTRASHVNVEDALSHVAGYMVGNDLSARDTGLRPQFPPPSHFYHSFLDHKSFEDAAPVGPWIVPASDIGDPMALSIRTEVNGEVRQDGSTSKMIFSIAEQIAYLSTVITLIPGDIIMTGTPAGTAIETGEFLSPGDTVTVSIEGIGSVTTSIV